MFWTRIIAALCIIALVSARTPDFSICESADETLIGGYTIEPDTRMDNAPIYSNGNDVALFRNKGFWYIGNLAPWPPETYYRCVEAEQCNMGLDTPPTGKGVWTASKKFGKEPVPVVVAGACPVDEL